jgi:glycosyltransferase involved in cell wall biosynthesis
MTALKRVLIDADIILAPTPYYKKLICEKYRIPNNKVKVLPNGTNFLIESARSLSNQNQLTNLLFAGRLSVQKNLPLMLETMRSYVDRYGNNIFLTIIGDGLLKKQIVRKISELDLSESVKVEKAVFGTELEQKFSVSDIFVLTSTHESFGLVLIEAMTKGVPIVGVDIPDIQNVVQNNRNGVFTANDPVELADALHKLIMDKKLYAEISKNNIVDAKKYRWEQVTKRLSEVYENI